MAGKPPALMLYVMDLLRDLAPHSNEIFGAWVRIFCHLHFQPERGQDTLELAQWARLLGETEERARQILAYIEKHEIGDVTFLSRDNLKNSQRCHVTCRRMIKEEKFKENARLRQQRKRKGADVTELSQECHGPRARARAENEYYTRDIEQEEDEEKQKTGANQTKEQAGKVVAAYNQWMGKRKTVTKGVLKTVKRNLDLDPEWAKKYLEAAVLFPKIDTSEWAGGSVSLEWSLHVYDKNREYAPVVDRILSGNYKIRGQSKPSSIQPPDWKESKQEKADPKKVRTILKRAREKLVRRDINE